ncbi:cilia- and flagella-associated protein 46 [Myxocyprinus asiaticus]|uniref:cilia- and flagella-associated protein 46 n=1 Tax=Myxocyprinus asiaticus TaxID=70543 RepID=UPI002221B660|nr:cilia- and flagella-associated protein 46 [Myxocyprinus asiaticus]
MDLRARQYLSKAQEKTDPVSLRKAYDLIRVSVQSVSDGRSVLSELCVLCAEQSLQLGCREIAQDCLMMYFEGRPPANQFLCRAYLCQAQLISPYAITTAEDLDKAVMYYLKAIEIAKEKPRYHFLVFNASLLYLQSVRMFLRSGQRQLLVSSLTKVLNALEEVQDADHTWRAELMLHLVECLLDAGQVKEAASLSKVASDFIESHKLELHPRLFSIQVRHNLIDVSEMLNEGNPKLIVTYKIQKLKHMVEVNKRRDDLATLKEIFLLLTQSSEPQEPNTQSSGSPSNIDNSTPQPEAKSRSSSGPPNIPGSSLTLDIESSNSPQNTQNFSSSPSTPDSGPPPDINSSNDPQNTQSSSPPPNTDSSSPVLDHSSSMPLSDRRIVLLLELAFLSLQLQQHQLASDCLKELRAANVTVGQRIMMECVQCELDLHKQRDRIENYSRSSVVLQLSVIGRLDVLLQTALKHGDSRVTQAVCASQWNTCMPLLQHNLKKRIQKPLLNISRALESTDSMLVDVLCQVHAELAVIEEEDEKLESAMKHLRKALELDQRGHHCQHLSSSLHLLQLRSSPHCTPARLEDRAAKLIQQAKEDKGHETMKKRRPLLVSAGITLAPDAFQVVLDADSKMEVSSSSEAQGRLAHLAAKAQQHASCVQKVKGHLTGLDKNTDDGERVKLWASLAKIARKQEVFDVCRAACRFCLLYDDGRWTNRGDHKNGASPVQRNQKEQNTNGELLRLLAEVHFINAEVTILKLRSEGVELNGSAVPPDERVTLSPEDDAHWNLYSDWIKDLSVYVTVSFLRGAELGAELGEAWLVANAAVYLWNYNSWLLATRGHRLLLPTFSRLLELLRQTGHAGEVVLVVMLCDAVAQGLIQPWCQTSVRSDQESQDKEKVQLPADKTKKARGKPAEKSGSSHGLPFDSAAVQDMRKALEVCVYALHLSNGNTEPVPIIVRKQLISTWVSIKQLLQQQIGLKLDINDEGNNEAVTSMSRVLVAVEMLQCNSNSRMMEFTLPSLTVLAQMAGGCQWTDSVVELYVWTQLALFAHQTHDHDLIMSCTHNALRLEQNATHQVKTTAQTLFSVCSVQEMLSRTACVRGQSLIHKAKGHHSSYMEGLHMLQSSVSYAEQADSWSLCVTAAGQYWNACLPLLDVRQVRRLLREPLELILKAMSRTYSKQTPGKRKRVSGVKDTGPLTEALNSTNAGTLDDDLKLWASMYNVLLYIHTDSSDWKKGLQVLDEAVREMPRSTHKLLVLKQRVLVKARLGESVDVDMQRISDEDELVCSRMWQRAARCANNKPQQLTCYQNAITTLLDSASVWLKVDFLLEFGEWLYFTHFPVIDARLQIECAVDILLFTSADTQQSAEVSVETGGVTPVEHPLGPGVSGVKFEVCLSDVREIGRLERLFRAHTLLALLEDRTSPKHQQHLLTAYSFTLHIWKVSLETAQEVTKEMLSSRSAADQPVCSSSSRKDKQRPDDKNVKQVKTSPVEEKPRGKAPEISLPISPEQWAQFECPEEIRQAFGYNTSPYGISSTTLSLQSRTLFYLDVLVRELESVSLIPLTFAPLHLAEVIAHDLIESKSHSDLYRLRIIRNCRDLGFESLSPYSEQLLSLTLISEDELMRCHKAIISQRNRSEIHEKSFSEGDWSRTPLTIRSTLDLWLEKADVCLSLSLYQSARVLLTQAHLSAKELGDQTSLAKSLHLLAVLANQEKRSGQALVLLQQAQEIGGDEQFWYLLVQTLLTAVVEQRQDDAYEQVCEITQQACRSLTSVVEQRLNRALVLRFFRASLESRAAVLLQRVLNPDGRSCGVTDASVEMFASVCNMLKHAASELLLLGYRTHAAEATLTHANTLRILAVRTASEEEKQRHLLDALYLLQKAVSIQEDVVTDVMNVLPPHESSWHGLPVVRVCVRLRLALADLALLMLEIQCAEEQRRTIARERKSSVERAVEEFMRSTTDLSDQEREWCDVGRSLGQTVLTHLTAVNSLSLDCEETRAQSLGMMGRCLRILAQQRDPLYPSTLWDEPIKDEEEMQRKEEEEEECSTNPERNETETKQYDGKCTELQNGRRAAQRLFAQASETLVQSVSLCLQHDLPHLLPHVCSDLLECHGQFEPSASGQYLALLQSGVVCVDMSSVLHAVCSGVSESQLCALMNLRRNLLSAHAHRPNALLTAVNRELIALSKACGHLTINPNHLRILGEIPSNFKILLLQHSNEGCVLYAGIYEQVKAAETQRGKSSTDGLICSKVVKSYVQHSDLLQLHKHLQDFKRLNAKTRLKESRHRDSEICKQAECKDEELDSVFRTLVEQMENYLHPVLSQLDFSCFSSRTPSISTSSSARAKDKDDKTANKPLPDAGVCVVILADRLLLELPLEALSVLQANGITSVSRDFSLQVLHARLQMDEAVESDNKKEAKGVRAVKGKGDQSRSIKVVPVNRVLPAHTIPVDKHKFRYIVNEQEGDDGKNSEWSSPAEIMRRILDTYKTQFTPLWEGFMGDERTHSLADLEQMLISCGSFIYSGTKNFLSCVPPSKLATLNMSGCQMVFLFDCGHKSILEKSNSQWPLEHSVGSAYLFTLSGVHSVSLNQWHSSATANAQNMHSLMENLLKVGLTSGQSVRALQTRTSENKDLSGKPSILTVDEILPEDCDKIQRKSPLSLTALNFVIYGLPNLVVT